MGITVEQRRYEILPVGEYQAKIGEVTAEDGQYGPQLKLRFDLAGAGLADRYVIGWCSQTFTPKSKLYAWAKAAFGGREIPPTYNLDTDHLLGKAVTLVLVTATGNDGQEYNKIHEVKPVRRNGSKAPASAPVQAPAQPVTRPAVVNPGATDVPSEPSWLANDGDMPF